MTPAKTLRDYQRESVAAVLRELDRTGSTMLVLPTGCGKTVVMAKLATNWQRGNVLLLAHRVELLDQAADKLEPELGYRPSIEQGIRAVDTDCLWQGGAVLVGSVQTMIGDRRLEKFRKLPFDLILVDECHHATSASYAKIIDYFRALNPSLKVLGVTATPTRADGTALGLVFDTAAFHLPMWEAIEAGWLTPIEQEYVAIESIDFDGVRTAQNEMGESDLKKSELEEILLEEENQHAMARPILDRAGERQCLVFTAGVKHAHALTAVLNRYRPDSAKAVDGKTDKGIRKGIVTDYAEGRLQFLVNFGVFCEGFDVPAVSLVAMGRPTKSVGLYTQMLGRGTRPLPDVVDLPALSQDPSARRDAILRSGKPHLSVLDFVGNSRHKLVSSIDILGGNYDVETRALAQQRIGVKPADVGRELKKAAAELALRREQDRRRRIKAGVSYTTEFVDPFGHDASPGEHVMDRQRGGCSDAQIALLVNLGVPRETAANYSGRQAGAVIDSLRSKRCTERQKATLAKFGESTDVNCDEAGRIIDAIAQNGWRPLPKGVPA